jgi:D-galactarolactone cycloisomerase
MRVTAVTVLRLAAPLARPFSWASGTARERRAILVRVATDAGLVGWGETLRPASGRLVERTLGPLLVGELLGEDAEQRDAVRARLRAALSGMEVAPVDAASALGAVDIALWDLAGKVQGVPLHRLLGPLGETATAQVEVYASGLYYDETGERSLDEEAEEAAAYRESGFRAVKMKIGRASLAEDRRRVAAVRRALGGDVLLLADANQAYDTAAAREMGAVLADSGAYWFEEPLPMDRREDYRALASSLPVLLAAGENLPGEELAHFLDGRLIGVAQPNVANVGGVAEARTVAETAAARGIPLSFHGWGSAVLFSATVHLAACLGARAVVPGVPGRQPLPPGVELDCTENPLRDALWPGALDGRGGTVAVPQGPGLGVDLDETALERWRVPLDV